MINTPGIRGRDYATNFSRGAPRSRELSVGLDLLDLRLFSTLKSGGSLPRRGQTCNQVRDVAFLTVRGHVGILNIHGRTNYPRAIRDVD